MPTGQTAILRAVSATAVSKQRRDLMRWCPHPRDLIKVLYLGCREMGGPPEPAKAVSTDRSDWQPPDPVASERSPMARLGSAESLIIATTASDSPCASL